MKALSKKNATDLHNRIVSTLGVERAAALGIIDPRATFGLVIETLKTLADERIADARRIAAARVPLISPRYATTLARGIHAVLTNRGEGGAFTWLSVTQQQLHAVYMTGDVPRLDAHDKHPGSRAGLVTIDCRRLADFATEQGEITLASVTARVKGEAKP